MFCDLSPYQSRRCKEIIEGKVENSENVRGLIEFIDAKFKTRAISAFYGAGKDSAWLKIVPRPHAAFRETKRAKEFLYLGRVLRVTDPHRSDPRRGRGAAAKPKRAFSAD